MGNAITGSSAQYSAENLSQKILHPLWSTVTATLK